METFGIPGRPLPIAAAMAAEAGKVRTENNQSLEPVRPHSFILLPSRSVITAKSFRKSIGLATYASMPASRHFC